MISRRSLLQFLALSPLAVLLPKIAEAGGKPANALGEAEPLAKAMQYVEDASKSTNPARTDKKANCASCQKFPKCSPADTSCKPVEKDGYGPCELFAGKVVSKNGWCLSWAKKA